MMELGDLSDLTRDELKDLCEQVHLAGTISCDDWARSEHALHVLVEYGIATKEQVEFARAIGTTNHEAGMALCHYKKMYDGPGRPLTERERQCVELR